ncbi:bifunctional nuclease family protein [Sediminivirga luteola]|uniref:BFN domain-containing protein n=1 Tax=Sediminivirga luteola TaxID=1774748 RepID=A0A8J2XLB5_9MICO|nr:bifunctional nuclease family protein [Sediminivirga luteola]MCI2266910.1 bifunctional nuclease family protein [Sediminivirga luteola]GGA21252.1 hypothetical protein GCM10011333_25480 [Sediminivirga luteola]
MREVEVLGVRVELPARQPILLLRSLYEPKYLPIWIGVQEANAIALALQGVEPPRPLTHQLLLNVVHHFGGGLERVEVTGLDGHTFLGELVFDDGRRLSCRPSDGAALALLAQVPVFVADELIDTAGVEMEVDDETEVEQFREFLDHVSAEDFESGGPDGPAESGGPDGPSEPGGPEAR